MAEADGVIEDIEQRKNLKVILLKIVDKRKNQNYRISGGVGSHNFR